VSRERVLSDLADGAGSPHYVTLLGLCNDVLRGRWTFAAMVMICATAAAIFRWTMAPTYTANASFIPDAVQPLQSGNDLLSSLAVLGNGGSGTGTVRAAPTSSLRSASAVPASGTSSEPLDPEFYWMLLHSRQLLVAVAGSPFTITTSTTTRSGTAADVYGLPPGPPDRRIEDAARRLEREIDVTYSEKSGILELSVRTLDPLFARAVAERLLDALLEQNRRMSDSRTVAQVVDLTRTTLEARRELGLAQEELARFLASNRAFVPASPLALEFHRRDADVVEKRSHYADLALQLERAKLDRSRATQLISVVERPETPTRPDPRGVLRTAIIGAIGGAALALLVILLRAHLRRLRAAGFDELAALAAEWRALRRSALLRGRSTVSPGVSSGSPGAGI
jgi:uncharacterized protein involved in exopolysaccharide biosynthesis